MGVTETRLEVDVFTPLPNYVLTRLERVRSEGGILFYIRESLPFLYN
jgi:hypothetical protein